MKTLDSTGPCIDPLDTPPVTGLQQDFVPLVTALWARPPGQISDHLTVHLSDPYFISYVCFKPK